MYEPYRKLLYTVISKTAYWLINRPLVNIILRTQYRATHVTPHATTQLEHCTDKDIFRTSTTLTHTHAAPTSTAITLQVCIQLIPYNCEILKGSIGEYCYRPYQLRVKLFDLWTTETHIHTHLDAQTHCLDIADIPLRHVHNHNIIWIVLK
jgi:hypothetical protein